MSHVPKPHEIAHPTLSLDTDPEAEKVQLDILRRMPPWRKVQLIDEAIQTSRLLAMAGLRHRHPNASPEELHRRFLGLWLGEELATTVYGPLPE
jgi:folate-binding Fe-S cluster repair protein YgfZ